MKIFKYVLTKIIFSLKFLCFSLFFWLSICNVNYAFAQTNDINADSEKSVANDTNASYTEKPVVIKPVDFEKTDSDQEKLGREAMAMIMEITKSNILYEKNRSSANLLLNEQKLKNREKQSKEMKEYNEKYNKKYLASFKSFEKMRGKHSGYSGVHSDYSAYLQKFLASTSR